MSQSLRSRIDTSLGWVDVSTVDVGGLVYRPETCLFLSSPDRSIVVETYGDWDSAVDGHARWSEDAAGVVAALDDRS